MLGPNGQSNGCVSFRNYPAFLNAFLRGEFERLVVVDRLAAIPSAQPDSTAVTGLGLETYQAWPGAHFWIVGAPRSSRVGAES